jgi:hypothetical protein
MSTWDPGKPIFVDTTGPSQEWPARFIRRLQRTPIIPSGHDQRDHEIGRKAALRTTFGDMFSSLHQR